MHVPVRDSFVIFQGSEFDRDYRWTSDGVPVNLTGWTGRAQFRGNVRDPAVVWDLTEANGRFQFVDRLDGRIRILVPSALSLAVTTSRLVFGVTLTAPDGQLTRLVEGVASLDPALVR